jgi:hypothetical protein
MMPKVGLIISKRKVVQMTTGLVMSPTEIEDTIVDADRENVDLIVIGGGKSRLNDPY